MTAKLADKPTVLAAPFPAGRPVLRLEDLDAVLFDLDGVLTDTASLHQAAWTDTFTELFEHLAAPPPGVAPPARFTPGDYRRLVDGQPRLDGVRHVLADRKITLPDGDPDDPPGVISISAVAAKKDGLFSDLLRERGPQVFSSAPGVLTRLRAAGVAVGVVSASRHCADVLAQAGLAPLVDVVIDAEVAATMRLAGKPDPATYLEAARRLGVDPARAAVVEDALAGVAAGRAGRFGTVVGVDRHHQPEALRQAGADLVVEDLGDLTLGGRGPLSDGWHLTWRPASDAGEGVRETLCTLANGYLGTRGAATWASDDGVRYPGTYLAGLYNRLASDIGGQVVQRESIVNAPNWLAVTFSADGGPYVGDPGVQVTGQELRLDLRGGVLRRRYQVTDRAGRRSTVTERRLVSMADPHLAAIDMEVVAENWAGTLRVRSGIDATGCAAQTTEARLLAHCHLQVTGSGEDPPEVVWLAAATTQSAVTVAEAARTRLDGAVRRSLRHHDGHMGHEIRVSIQQGGRVHLEKVAAVYTSRDRAISQPAAAARQAAATAAGFETLLEAHRAAWARLWSHALVEVEAAERPSGLVNLHLFHLLQVASPHTADLDCGLGARGLHGEGYEGHVFWDELFVFRVLNLRFPEVSRALLRYRHRRLPAARLHAAASGERGARFPWQSASDGTDVTPTVLFNPRSGRWMADRSANQRHVGLAVAYNAWRYFEATGDREFLADAGAELIFDVALHFAHLASYDQGLGRYRIKAVMGPDEFHDGYPWTDEPGVDDNAYTNVLAAWVLTRAVEAAGTLGCDDRDDLFGRLGIDDDDLARLETVSRRLHVPFHSGVISQFDRYRDLEPIDLDAYRARYRNIGRLDLILEAEGDTVRRYQVAKQADVLMLFYLFSPPELQETFDRLGYQLSDDCVRDTISYYNARVTHGSTLSRVVHAWVAARSDRAASWRHLSEALAADMADTQGGTTREGIHLGAMAGTVDILGGCYPGLQTRAGALTLDPALPEEIDRLRLAVTYRGHQLDIGVAHDQLSVASTGCQAAPIQLGGDDQELTLRTGARIRRLTEPAAKGRRSQGGTPPAPGPGQAADGRLTTPDADPLTQPRSHHKAHPQEEPMATVTDPVCGMSIQESAAAGRATHEGVTYHFCSSACQEQFEAEPDKYATAGR